MRKLRNVSGSDFKSCRARSPATDYSSALFGQANDLAPNESAAREVPRLRNGEFFKNRKLDQQNTKVYRASVGDEDFQKVKAQFRALGLITKDEWKRDQTFENPRALKIR